MATPILLKANGTVIPATLNDTVAAQDFRKRLSFTVSGHRSAVDYCCTAASGIFDPAETQSGWKNGDISLAGGWFAILFDGEENSSDYRGMMVIAHIDEENLELVKSLPRCVLPWNWRNDWHDEAALSDEDMEVIGNLDLGHSEIIDHSAADTAKFLNGWKIHE